MSATSRPTASDTLDPIPFAPLHHAGPVSTAFRAAGATTLRDAFDYVWRLPYGRNERASEPLAPLEEGRATCSTKHALLARLAVEQGFDIELRIGIYLMREANTPGVGAVLAEHGLDAIPEAHCYIVADGARIDVTRYDAIADEPISVFLHEEPIEPGQVGDYKRSVHRQFIATWATSPDAKGHSPAELWDLREACIAALAE